MTEKRDSYVVIPQQEYARLYNNQYAELMTLCKSVDPNEQNETCLKATLKKHYPQVYKDMVKNDYIMTSSK